MTNKRHYELILSGVGGQGVLTVAKIVLQAALFDGLKGLQSEVHGMSQRGGAVNAQIVLDDNAVTSPLVVEGNTDMLISLEPLEGLRYLEMLKKDAVLISSTIPLKNMNNYPEDKKIIKALKEFPKNYLFDTAEHAKTLNNRHAGNITLLGFASKFLSIKEDSWILAIKEAFAHKADVLEKNIEAFKFGRNL